MPSQFHYFVTTVFRTLAPSKDILNIDGHFWMLKKKLCFLSFVTKVFHSVDTFFRPKDPISNIWRVLASFDNSV